MPKSNPNRSSVVNESPESGKRFRWQTYLRTHVWSAALVAFLTLGALGASLKYLEEDANRQMRNGKLSDSAPPEQSLLNSINPFLAGSSAAMTSATPQLSKEYIYAGGKMLAVEDAGANAAPPADLAVWRPSDGTWYVLGGQGSQQTTMPWGANGDTTVPGDYDGDGKTDFSIFRKSTGYWYIQNSSNPSTMLSYYFGASSDETAQADYDGDGKTDAAVFRPSTGYWYIQRSSDSGLTATAFGYSSDTPAPADYDGDGKADIAVWRGSAASFFILKSSDGLLQTIVFGQSGDQPVPGDYDGDGRADAAVWRAGSNLWLVLRSSNGATTTSTFGTAGSDKAVQNDYDGDGRVDQAVWRPSNGTWYILQSSREGQSDYMRQTVWGQSGDIPVPAFYRR